MGEDIREAGGWAGKNEGTALRSARASQSGPERELNNPRAAADALRLLDLPIPLVNPYHVYLASPRHT